MRHLTLGICVFWLLGCSSDSDEAARTEGVDPGPEAGGMGTTMDPPDDSPPPAGTTPTGQDPSTPTFGASGVENPEGGIAEMGVSASGATYDVLGRPVDGATEPLVPLVGYNQFWFAWAVFNPGSDVFGSTEPVIGDPIEGDEQCAVPCDEHRSGGPPKGIGDSGIPALSQPEMVSPDSPDASYLDEGSFVVGLAVGDDVRAYPHNIFWWHEIVNDVIGGVPLAVTHCPLTFSSITHDPTAFEAGKTLELGVSGKLYNSNLVFFVRGQTNDAFYDPAATETVFSQLLGVATGVFADDGLFAPIVGGETVGMEAPRVPSFEMTWAAWKSLFRETSVVSENTGFARTYTQAGYPYGSYFVDSDTFGTVVQDSRFPEKEFTYGLRVNGAAKAYPYSALADWAREQNGADAPPRGVLNDEVGGVPIAVVFDIEASYVQAFDATDVGEVALAE